MAIIDIPDFTASSRSAFSFFTENRHPTDETYRYGAYLDLSSEDIEYIKEGDQIVYVRVGSKYTTESKYILTVNASREVASDLSITVSYDLLNSGGTVIGTYSTVISLPTGTKETTLDIPETEATAAVVIKTLSISPIRDDFYYYKGIIASESNYGYLFYGVVKTSKATLDVGDIMALHQVEAVFGNNLMDFKMIPVLVENEDHMYDPDNTYDLIIVYNPLKVRSYSIIDELENPEDMFHPSQTVIIDGANYQVLRRIDSSAQLNVYFNGMSVPPDIVVNFKMKINS